MKFSKHSLIEKAKTAKRESKYFEFKESFDVDSVKEWCEIIKDIVAIANSGGGIIVFGVKNNGSVSSFKCNKILELDSAILTDKMNKYTNILYHDFEVVEIKRGRKVIAGLIIEDIRIPMIFCRPGTYIADDGKTKSAFVQGTLYYRHGAKSEPCNSHDLKEVIERNLDQIKKSWLGNIKKVVTAPTDSKVEIHSPSVIMTTNATATPMRISDDVDAPIYQISDPNKTHPLRQKDLIDLLQKETSKKLNSFHIQCIKKEFKVDVNRPDFIFKSMFGTNQYSKLFADWLVEKYKLNNLFFDEIRDKYLKHRH